jgi:hypothetical protein
MTAIRLLSAPVDPTSTQEAASQSTSLVPSSPLLPAPWNTKQNDSSYPADDFVWTASASEDGSFTFYAAPQKNSANAGSSGWDGTFAGQQSASTWSMLGSRNAVAQYNLHSSFPLPVYADGNGNGQLVNVYA